MRYYQVGIVDYQPRMMSGFRDGIADYSDYYEVGEAVPIIVSFKKETLAGYINQSHIYWMQNTIEGLKAGDPVIINWGTEEMFRIRVDARGVGVEEKET